MKSTILSEKDAKLIEKAIIQYGRILSVHNLTTIFKELSGKSGCCNLSLK